LARPREFEIDDAVERAMHVFWERGYEGAALPDLLAGMGSARGSLYKAFGDKKSLYLKALAMYAESEVAEGIRMLRDKGEPNGARRIAGLFSSIVDGVRDGDRRGCLLCSAAAGPASGDADISKAVADMLSDITDAFREALAAAPAARDMPHDRQRSRAHALTAAYVGLRVLAKSGQSVAALTRAARAATADIVL